MLRQKRLRHTRRAKVLSMAASDSGSISPFPLGIQARLFTWGRTFPEYPKYFPPKSFHIFALPDLRLPFCGGRGKCWSVVVTGCAFYGQGVWMANGWRRNWADYAWLGGRNGLVNRQMYTSCQRRWETLALLDEVKGAETKSILVGASREKQRHPLRNHFCLRRRGRGR